MVAKFLIDKKTRITTKEKFQSLFNCREIRIIEISSKKNIRVNREIL